MARHKRERVRSDRFIAGMVALVAVASGSSAVAVSHPGPAQSGAAPATAEPVQHASSAASERTVRAAVADYLAIRSTQAAREATRSRRISALQDELAVAKSVLTESAPDAGTILAVAARYAGTPYRRGGASPSGFDCSGYTKFVFGHVGVLLPRVSQAQYRWAGKVRANEAKPGDLVFFHGVGGHVYHVAIYAGHGMVWHSPYPGKSVEKVHVFGRVTYGRVPVGKQGTAAARRVAELTAAIAAERRA